MLQLLRSNFILLNEEEEDSLLWSGDDKCGIFSAKKGYKVLAEEAFEGEVIVVVEVHLGPDGSDQMQNSSMGDDGKQSSNMG
jgi:hypothetical protein